MSLALLDWLDMMTGTAILRAVGRYPAGECIIEEIAQYIYVMNLISRYVCCEVVSTSVQTERKEKKKWLTKVANRYRGKCGEASPKYFILESPQIHTLSNTTTALLSLPVSIDTLIYRCHPYLIHHPSLWLWKLKASLLPQYRFQYKQRFSAATVVHRLTAQLQ
jgi:hypothetical protein